MMVVVFVAVARTATRIGALQGFAAMVVALETVNMVLWQVFIPCFLVHMVNKEKESDQQGDKGQQ